MSDRALDKTFDRLLQAFLDHDQQTLEDLARSGVPVDLRDARGHTVLLRAAALGETAAVEWILQAGAEVDAASAPETDAHLRTAFLLAAAGGHPTTAETLLASGANPNRVDATGTSALMLAAHRGHLETVRFLVRSGVDLDLRNERGETALTLAHQAEHQDIVALLQALGAAGDRPPTETTLGTTTPTTHLAEQEWQNPAMPRLLQPHTRHTRSAGGSPDNPLTGNSLRDDIEDQISDWIDDEVADRPPTRP